MRQQRPLIDTTGWVSTQYAGVVMCVQHGHLHTTWPHCSWDCRPHDGMWVEICFLINLAKVIYLISLYIAVISKVPAFREMLSTIISDNNIWRMFLFLCHEYEGKLSSKIDFRCCSCTD